MADRQRLLDDLGSVAFVRGVEQGFWEPAEVHEWIVYVRLHAPDGRTFLGEFDCTGYGDEPIRCQFVDPDAHQRIPSAWPRGNGVFNGWVKFSGTELFVCWDQDREGIRHHPAWRDRRAWTRKPNQIVAYLDFLRQLLHVPARGYEHRTPSAA